MENTATEKKFKISLDERFKFITLIIISRIVNYQQYPSVKLEGWDMFIKDHVKYMESNGLLEIRNEKYIPTQKGREYLKNFFAKYFEFLKMFDVFSLVDTDSGEFAFEKYYDFNTDQEWDKYKDQERFSDVRVAVAEFKKLSPTEIVFMSFLDEGKFETMEDGKDIPKWQIAITDENLWKEIEDICNTAISLEYLRDEQEVIEDIVKKGSELMIKLFKKEKDLDTQRQQDEEEQEEIVETVTTEEYVEVVEPPFYTYDYFDPYYDIYYVSPIWFSPWIWL